MMARPDRKLNGLLALLDRDAAVGLPADVRAADLWDAWQFAADESALALAEWMSAAPDEKELGYDAYVACLDREEQAATALAERVDPAAANRLRARR
jgi:hypothetical protein